MISWLFQAALAQEVCDIGELTEPSDHLSVAWVSPLARRARGKEWLYVVPTSQLRAYAQKSQGRTGRVLQWLGLRRKDKTPVRTYKVVIFDTSPQSLCRPIEPSSPESVEPIAGVAPCDEDHRGPQHHYEGCGWLTDRATGEPSIEVYRARWNTLAGDGFCVLPIDRFMAK